MTFTLPLQLMILTLTANYIWDGFDTYDEAGDFILQTSYTYKTGREVYVGWDSKVRIGFTIEGDKGSGYQLLSYCLPFELTNAIDAIKATK